MKTRILSISFIHKVVLSTIFFFLIPAITHAASIGVAKTGQTVCYNAAGSAIACTGTGQDGEMQAGVAWPNPRFTYNGNETVTDNMTGLVWETRGGRGSGTWQQALDYIKTMNSNDYHGYHDWRLPNINELASLVDSSHSSPALPTGHPFANVQTGYNWSSTSMVSTSAAGVVHMYYGFVSAEDKKVNNCYWWAVRGGQSGTFGKLVIYKTGQTVCYDTAGTAISCDGTRQDGQIQAGAPLPTTRFTDNGNQTVTDNSNQLIWSKNANLAGGYKTWQQALDYIKTLNSSNYQGYNDWRLPNRNEMASLIDRSRSSPALPTGHPFANVQTGYYWSSSTYIDWTDNAWKVNMLNGDVTYGGKTLSYSVWPVRGGQSGSFGDLVISKSGSGTGTVTSNPSGINCGATCSASFVPGTNVTLTATPDSGSTFSGWSGGGCSGTQTTCQVTMDSDKTVSATFALKTYVVSVAKTGQTVCYNAAGSAIACTGTGQDGEFQMGVAWPNPRFTDNGNWTVTDNMSGLVWSKDANPAGGYKSWQQALDYIKTLNSSNYRGYNDWRLPNINELISLMDCSRRPWFIHDHPFANVQAHYWSSSTYIGSTYLAWYVDFYNGLVTDSYEAGVTYVWPVRGGQSDTFGKLVIYKTGQTVCYNAAGSAIACGGTGQDGEL